MGSGEFTFPHRNGFALHEDLGNPRQRQLLRLCLREDESFGGEGRFNWSRQWEYPYVLGNLPEDGTGKRILDAGCGYRFLAPMLARRGFEVDACGFDASVGPKYDEIAARYDVAIEFTHQHLAKMTYADETFDYISCISVLEHERDRAGIVREFRRCLRPGGSLLLTFDVSVRGDREIPIEGAESLVGLIEEEFTPATPFVGGRYFDEVVLSRADEVLRTEWFRRNRPELLPWGFISRASLKNMLRGKFSRPFFDLAIVGLVVRKDG
jgi:SAM-dependent methyltransferase